MSYPTRRARIEAEQAEKLAFRSRRNKKFSLGIAGLATAASATLFGMAPANAALDDVAAPSSSTTSTASATSSSATYTIQSGDTLSKIAQRHGVALNSLMSVNGLSASTVIYPGEVLELPGGSTSSSTTAGVGPNSTADATESSAAAPVSYQTASTSSVSGAKAAAIDKAIAIVNSGAAYSYGANGPSAYDCSSFTQTAFAAAGISIPRTSSQQFAAGTKISINNLQPGDLVFWSNNGSGSGVYHVAMYIGDGKIAQARNPQAGISIDSLSHYQQYNPPMSTAVRF